jgi:hypothetical protein
MGKDALLERAGGGTATTVSGFQEEACKDFGPVMRYVKAIAGHTIFRAVNDRRV